MPNQDYEMEMRGVSTEEVSSYTKAAAVWILSGWGGISVGSFLALRFARESPVLLKLGKLVWWQEVGAAFYLLSLAAALFLVILHSVKALAAGGETDA